MKTPTTWKKIKLNDICDEITVGHVGPMASEYVDSGIPFLRSQNVKLFSVDISDIKFITPDFHKKLKKSALHPGDVVVVRTGYPGVATVIPKTLSESNCSDLVIIRKSQNIDSFFLACIFNSQWGQSTVSGNLVGAAQQHFNIGAAKEVTINIPPLPTQQKIAAILSAYDDLIGNNTRRIRILEEMAQAIYREWFVNFRFPGHEGVRMVESELGPVPEGWKIKKVKTLVNRLPAGQVYTLSEVSDEGLVPVIDQSRDEILGYHNNDADHKASLESPIIIFGDHTCKMQLFIEPFSVGPNVIPFISVDNIPLLYLYYIIHDLVETKEYKRHWIELTNKVVVIAPAKQAQLFSKIVEQYFEQLRLLKLKNANLRRTRDLLLPKLISGELDVSELDIRIPDAEV
jgi:type I restriction enzyme S subunit